MKEEFKLKFRKNKITKEPIMKEKKEKPSELGREHCFWWLQN